MSGARWLAVVLCCVPACASPPAASDDAGAPDARGDAAPSDAATSDAEATTADAASDAGRVDDATPPPMDGAPIDAASTDDAAPSDGGPLDDASGVGDDAATSIDAATSADAASSHDAATPTDTAATTCDVTVSPPLGSSSTRFDFAATTNGTACHASLDGGPLLVVPCTGTLSTGGFAIGAHHVTLFVSGGPSGDASCSTDFVVEDADAGLVGDAGATSCAIEVLPTSGGSSTTFTASFESNGARCTLSVDGFVLGAVPCVGSYAGSGSLLGPGTHVAALDVASGPNGATRCTSSFVVTP